jgi:hypothetical protein
MALAEGKVEVTKRHERSSCATLLFVFVPGVFAPLRESFVAFVLPYIPLTKLGWPAR